jgi:hypothetical protein
MHIWINEKQRKEKKHTLHSSITLLRRYQTFVFKD